MALSWFEMNFPFQIYVPCRKESLVKIRIQGTDGHIQFRMVCQDMIGRLSLFDQWGNDLIRSEEHTSELQSRFELVCRLLLEKKKHDHTNYIQHQACFTLL